MEISFEIFTFHLDQVGISFLVFHVSRLKFVLLIRCLQQKKKGKFMVNFYDKQK